MLTSGLPLSRRVFLALAALALLAVLLRPACELWFAHAGVGSPSPAAGAPIGHGGNPAVHCCASVSDGQQLAPLQVVSGGLRAPEGGALAALAVVVAGIAVLTRRQHWLRAPPRRPRSFYLRSARILR